MVVCGGIANQKRENTWGEGKQEGEGICMIDVQETGKMAAVRQRSHTPRTTRWRPKWRHT